jgi:hypothetical protein
LDQKKFEKELSGIKAKCKNLEATLDLIKLALDDRGTLDLHSERYNDTQMILYVIALKLALEKLHCTESDSQSNTTHKEVTESRCVPPAPAQALLSKWK